MNKRKICIIMHNDLMDYPPMISLIDIMKELGEDIIYWSLHGFANYKKIRGIRGEVNKIRLYKIKFRLDKLKNL